MKKIDLFSTPIVQFNIKNSDSLNVGLLSYIKDMKEEIIDGAKQPYSMVGGKHTDFSLFYDFVEIMVYYIIYHKLYEAISKYMHDILILLDLFLI